MAKLSILIFSVLLYSCSAQYHLNKAIKKGYKCEETGDTIRITTLDSIPVIVNDTIVWEKFISTKDTVIKYKNVYVPKTRIELKREYKIKVKLFIKTGLLKNQKPKQTGKKTDQKEFKLLFVGVGIGLLLSYLWKYAKKSLI